MNTKHLYVSIFISLILHTFVLLIPLQFSQDSKNFSKLNKHFEFSIELDSYKPEVASQLQKPASKKPHLFGSKLLKEYSLMLEQRIYNKLYIPNRLRDKEINLSSLVTLEINRDGSLNRLFIIEKTGNKTMDNLVIAAIEASSPFPPLPYSIDNLKVELPLRFVVKKKL